MSIGATAENQALLFMVTIIAFIAIPVLLAVLWLVIGLIGRPFRIPSAASRVISILVIPVALLAVSLRLDEAAQPLTAQVIDKEQRIEIQHDGYWKNERSLTVRYAPDGTPLPPFTTTAAASLAASPFETAVLWPTAADFDRAHPGDVIEIRVLSIREGFSLVRFPAQSTATLLPWTLILGIGAGLILLMVALAHRTTSLGSTLLAVLFLAALAYPLANAYRSWKQHDDLSGATQRMTAVVQKATRITQVSMGVDSRRRYYTVPQPYEIVQFAMELPGFPDPIVGVDAVDVTGGSFSRFGVGASLEVAYTPDNPREARILNQTRTHYFQTTFGIYRDGAIYALALAVLAAFGAWLKQRILRGA